MLNADIQKILKKIPVISRIYWTDERLRNLEIRCQDLEETLNEIALGAPPAEALMRHYCRNKGGNIPDFKNPNTFNDKILWLNLYEDTPLKRICADKYAVREWVAKEIGKEYLVPLLGIWNSFDEINFADLPDKFVLKPTHASGCNVIVRDKSKIDLEKLKKHFDYWLDYDYSRRALEKCYMDIPRRIMAEEFLESEVRDIPDYKFFCIHGEPKLCWIDLDRTTHHTRNVYDTEWNLLPLTIEYPASPKIIPKPEGFPVMLELARKLSAPFIQVRADFYNIGNKVYFGELTFVSGGGHEIFTPDSYNAELGKWIRLPQKKGE